MASDLGASSPSTMCRMVMMRNDDRDADRVQDLRIVAGEGLHHRADDPGEGRLADPAQGQAGQGDAELGRREVGVEVADHVPRHLGRA